MPLQFQNIEVPLLGGLSEHDDPKSTPPGKLHSSVNVEFMKRGRLNKRRGYKRIPLTEATGETVDQILCAVATYRDELVVFGFNNLYAVGDRTDRIGSDDGGKSLVRRSYVPRAAVRRQDVAAGGTAQTQPIPAS